MIASIILEDIMERGMSNLSPRKAVLLLAVAILGAAPAQAGGSAEASPVPNAAFYDWVGAPRAAPGTLLRSEELPGEFALVDAAKSIRILYSSTNGVDGLGTVAVSGALFIPKGKPPAGGWSLLNWAHGTTGIADICAPSRLPRSKRDAAYLGAWLRAGYAVAASDYQGLGTPGIHPYSNYRAASYSVLDMARAATQAGYPIERRGAIIAGQSQGAGAAVAAGGYAPRYAPELAIAGVIATGLPNLSREAILSGLAWSATDAMVTGAYAMIEYELSHVHPEIKAEDIFTPAGLPLGALVETACLGDLMKEASNRQLNPAVTFKPGMLARLWNTDVDLRSFPTEQLSMPLFVGIGLSDTAALPATTMKLVEQMCIAGSSVSVRAYRGQDHSGVVISAIPDVLAFAAQARKGRAGGDFCSPAPSGPKVD